MNDVLRCVQLLANDADAPEANASEATDNSEFHTAAVIAADVTEAATFKKPTGRWSDGTSEKEVEAEAFKKPPGKLSAEPGQIFQEPIATWRID